MSGARGRLTSQQPQHPGKAGNHLASSKKAIWNAWTSASLCAFARMTASPPRPSWAMPHTSTVCNKPALSAPPLTRHLQQKSEKPARAHPECLQTYVCRKEQKTQPRVEERPRGNTQLQRHCREKTSVSGLQNSPAKRARPVTRKTAPSTRAKEMPCGACDVGVPGQAGGGQRGSLPPACTLGRLPHLPAGPVTVRPWRSLPTPQSSSPLLEKLWTETTVSVTRAGPHPPGGPSPT